MFKEGSWQRDQLTTEAVLLYLIVGRLVPPGHEDVEYGRPERIWRRNGKIYIYISFLLGKYHHNKGTHGKCTEQAERCLGKILGLG